MVNKILGLCIFFANFGINAHQVNDFKDWMAAIRSGDLNTVKKVAAKINLTSNMASIALYMAAAEGYQNIVIFLLQAPEINVNYKIPTAYFATSSLMQAAFHNDEEIVKILLATPDININDQDKWGNTALMFAVSADHKNIIKLLLDAGADSSIKNRNGETAIDIASKEFKPILVTLINESNLSQWFDAARTGDLNKITELIQQVEVNNRGDGIIDSALMTACFYDRDNIVRSLLQVPNINVNAQNLNGATALMFAAIRSNAEIVKLLLDAGSENLENIQGKMAIDMASPTFKPILEELINEAKTKRIKLFSEFSNKLYSLSKVWLSANSNFYA